MNEKEKMLSGQLYNANDPELCRQRAACKELCHDYNLLRPSDAEGQERLIRRLLGRTGTGVCVTAPFWCDYGYNIKAGKNFYVNHNCTVLDCAEVSFGDNVFIGPDCGFYTAGHPLDAERRNAGLEYAKPIIVEDDVWIGGGTRVMPGVTIGRGAVIGGGSVVTKDVPGGVVAAGNPCRVIKTLD